MPKPLIQPVYIYRADVARVVDADTLIANIDCGLRIWAHGQRIRLAGINAPELGREDKAGETARTVLIELLTISKMSVVVETFTCREDQYGRWLGIIYAGDKKQKQFNVNLWMVTHGFAISTPRRQI